MTPEIGQVWTFGKSARMVAEVEVGCIVYTLYRYRWFWNEFFRVRTVRCSPQTWNRWVRKAQLATLE